MLALLSLILLSSVRLYCTLLVRLEEDKQVRLVALTKPILLTVLAASVAAVAARGMASQFTNAFAQLGTGLAVGGLIYLVVAAPQAIGFTQSRADDEAARKEYSPPQFRSVGWTTYKQPT